MYLLISFIISETIELLTEQTDCTQEFYSNFYHIELSNDDAKKILLDSGLEFKKRICFESLVVVEFE